MTAGCITILALSHTVHGHASRIPDNETMRLKRTINIADALSYIVYPRYCGDVVYKRRGLCDSFVDSYCSRQIALWSTATATGGINVRFLNLGPNLQKKS